VEEMTKPPEYIKL